MIQGIYQGAASMNALEKWQASIAGNLASGSVAGFKKDDTSFSSAMSGLMKADPDDFNAMQHVVPMATSRVTDSQGGTRQTGKDFDFAVQGPGYFQIKTPNNGTAYTRNGEFHLDAKGTLVNGAGLEVAGESGAITADPTLGPLSVDRTGQVTQGATAVGKIALYDLSKSKDLQRTGPGLLVPGDGSTPPRVEKPEVLQGFIEESNVVPLQEMVNLITVSRAYEVSQKLITSLDQTGKAAIETLGTP